MEVDMTIRNVRSSVEKDTLTCWITTAEAVQYSVYP